MLCIGTAQALPPDPVMDSLKTVLAGTSDSHARIALLLNMKDLNEDNELNLPYSTHLFREAVAVGDTYAMSAAIVPILDRYAPHPEKEDSLQFYIRTLREMTPGTPQEGISEFAELYIAYQRFSSEIDRKKRKEIAREIKSWYENPDIAQGNLYRRTNRLILLGQIAAVIPSEEQRQNPSKARFSYWEEAYEFINTMPDPAIRRDYAELLYNILGTGYYHAKEDSRLAALTDIYIRQLDEYFAYERKIGRRPYLYGESNYQLPYWQLIRSTARANQPETAAKYFNQFRQRMLASSKHLGRNLSCYYELGYLWKFYTKEFEQSLLYCDSLTDLIERKQGYLRMKPVQIAQTYRNRSGILKRLGRYDDAYKAYARTFEVQDSLFTVARNTRTEAIAQRNEMDRLLLAQTHDSIRNQIIAMFCAVIVGILLIAIGVYYYRALRRNRKLRDQIYHHSRKALESERMKSMFVNSICNHIRSPFDAVDQAAYKLTIRNLSEYERNVCLRTIRKNTELLLSTLDNILEAANLDSLTEELQLAPTDIGIICNAEICRAEQQRPNSDVQYVLDAPQSLCIAWTNAHYFTFVIRALLDNAGKFTAGGRITLKYESDEEKNEFRISVSDTGCGVPAEHFEEIFNSEIHDPASSHGMSLALCRLIALHLKGNIHIDKKYSRGAKFIFTIPIRP